MPGREVQANVAGLGVDIVEVERMRRILERSPRFKMRVFSEAERDYCESKVNPATHYALRFAAKEAVLKALGCGFGAGIGFTDVTVENDEQGRPHPILAGRVAQIAAEQGVTEIHLSLSYTHETAVANALAATEATKVEAPEEKRDQKQELADAFKELRGMLDDLEERSQHLKAQEEDRATHDDHPDLSAADTEPQGED